MGLKSVKYSIQKNNFKKDMYYGSVLSKGSSDLIDVLYKYRDKIPEEIMKEMVNDIEVSICEMLAEGYSVSLGSMLTLSPTIKGKFEGPDDLFDPGRHSLDITAEVGISIKEFIQSQQIKFKKVDNIRRAI